MSEPPIIGQHAIHGGNVYKSARRLGVSPDEILDFSASLNPLGPPLNLLQHLSAVMQRMVHYPEPFCALLKETLARRHGLTPEHILVGNGSTQLIYLVPRVLNPRRVLIIAPAFGEYERAAEVCGCELVYDVAGPSNDFIPTPEQAEGWLDSGADMIFLGNPSNPVGCLVPPDTLDSVAAQVSKRNIILVVDEAFIDFRPGMSLLDQGTLPENVVVLRSFTKIYALPGLRLGYLVAAPSLTARLESFQEPWSVNFLAQAAGLYCLQVDDYVDRSVAFVDREREKMRGDLAELDGFTLFPSGVNYLMARMEDPHLDADLLQERIMTDKILIRNCGSFRGLSKSYVRMAVRRREENERLVRAIEKAIR